MSVIFYESKPARSVEIVADGSKLGVEEYLWMERLKGPSKRLQRKHAAQRNLATALGVLLGVASITFGVAAWPKQEEIVITKRVHWNECNGLLTVYGNRCN